jgi:hypothetical protein
MSLTNPNLVYTLIYESIVGKRVAPANAALFLDEFLKKKDKVRIFNSAISAKDKKSAANMKLAQK